MKPVEVHPLVADDSRPFTYWEFTRWRLGGRASVADRVYSRLYRQVGSW